MIDKQLIVNALKAAIDYSKADQTEVLATSGSNALTRFSNNQIHQNVSQTNMSISVRTIIDKKIGYASTNRLDEHSIKKTVDKSIEIAKFKQPDAELVSLPTPKPIVTRDLISNETISFSPMDRAKAIQKLMGIVEPQNLTAAGAFSTGYTIIGIANSLGILTVGAISEADLKTVVMAATGSAYGSSVSIDVGSIDIERIGRSVKKRALDSQNPSDIDPGVYPVILSPDAVADMISFLAFAGFGALAKQEGRSFMGDRIGQQVVGSKVSIWDNALDENTIGLPFDFEGVPKQKVVFIENGVAKAFCYDSYTAQKESVESTGHALPAPNTYGPLPLNLIMASGNTPIGEIIKTCERAILVNRFHYTNLEDPIRTIFTGMTRDGTFLIENGKIKTPVKNLRFTQNIVEALSQVEELSSERELKDAILGGAYVPWAKIAEFKFTGATQF
ncbi:MAG: TldD/PmbA family protein [Rubrobacteridae bacterium]|nr:TldD/PmbA family protein [Rubrobacteridae bacterium]